MAAEEEGEEEVTELEQQQQRRGARGVRVAGVGLGAPRGPVLGLGIAARHGAAHRSSAAAQARGISGRHRRRVGGDVRHDMTVPVVQNSGWAAPQVHVLLGGLHQAMGPLRLSILDYIPRSPRHHHLLLQCIHSASISAQDLTRYISSVSHDPPRIAPNTIKLYKPPHHFNGCQVQTKSFTSQESHLPTPKTETTFPSCNCRIHVLPSPPLLTMRRARLCANPQNPQQQQNPVASLERNFRYNQRERKDPNTPKVLTRSPHFIPAQQQSFRICRTMKSRAD